MNVDISKDEFQDYFQRLGIKVKQVRLLKGLTLEDLGLEIGLDKSAIFHIEKGKPITLTTLLKIANVLEVEAKELLPNLFTEKKS